jgi:two-component system cell cycle response regulator
MLRYAVSPEQSTGVSAPRTILVADDSPLVLRMLERMLGEAGFSVLTAGDGLEAIEKAFAEDVSLVILDVTMPRMNGYQACRILKTEPLTRAIPVILLTGRDQPGDRFWGLETGADYFVTKDSEPQKILELVQRLTSQAPPHGTRDPEARRTSVDVLSRVNDLLDRKLFEATTLSEIGRVARSLVHFDETFSSVMTIVARAVDFTVGGMAFVEGDDLDVVLALRRPAAPEVVEEAKARLLEAVNRNFGGSSLGSVQARLVALPGTDTPARTETQLAGFASFPVVTNGRLSGLLALGGRAAARLTPEVESFLGLVANQAQIVIENSRLFDKIKNLSIRDGLTDLFNHRHSIELLGNEFARVGRYAGPVSVLMMDLDHFKDVNDLHGHLAGDIVLKEVSRVLKDTLRTVDALGRYGGEEFLAVLAHTSREEALQTGERLRRAIHEHVFRVGDKELRVTVSVGVASHPDDGMDSPMALIREADLALYRAKQGGRNRVA